MYLFNILPTPLNNNTSSTKIVAIGRNYAAHAKELGNAVPKEPFFFLKPTSSYVPAGGKIEIPRGIIAHHEGAFVVLSVGPEGVRRLTGFRSYATLGL